MSTYHWGNPIYSHVIVEECFDSILRESSSALTTPTIADGNQELNNVILVKLYQLKQMVYTELSKISKTLCKRITSSQHAALLYIL